MTNDQLRKLREEMGWTQSFLAAALNVGRGTYSHWEAGRALVPTDVAKAVTSAHEKVASAINDLQRSAP